MDSLHALDLDNYSAELPNMHLCAVQSHDKVLFRGEVEEKMLQCRVDGLHAIDLDNYIAEFPNSAIAALAASGVKYDKMYLPPPSDSWPALAHHITGAGSEQHGIIYGAWTCA